MIVKPLFLIAMSVALICSCKKEAQYDPDSDVSYAHWIRVIDTDTIYDVYVPNCFTPNGDGVNDCFEPEGDFTPGNLVVFDRSGKALFETSHPGLRWEGDVNGTAIMAPSGSYQYKLKIFGTDDQGYEYNGIVMLFK